MTKLTRPVVSLVSLFSITSEVAFKISRYKERHDKIGKTPYPLWAMVSLQINSIRNIRENSYPCLKVGITFSDGSTIKIGSLEGDVKLVGSSSLAITRDLSKRARRLAVTLANEQATAALSLEEATKRIEEITRKLARTIVLHAEQRES